jgi:hypothetical protein
MTAKQTRLGSNKSMKMEITSNGADVIIKVDTQTKPNIRHFDSVVEADMFYTRLEVEYS